MVICISCMAIWLGLPAFHPSLQRSSTGRGVPPALSWSASVKIAASGASVSRRASVSGERNLVDRTARQHSHYVVAALDGSGDSGLFSAVWREQRPSDGCRSLSNQPASNSSTRMAEARGCGYGSGNRRKARIVRGEARSHAPLVAGTCKTGRSSDQGGPGAPTKAGPEEELSPGGKARPPRACSHLGT
jgi:hypothetical protein